MSEPEIIKRKPPKASPETQEKAPEVSPLAEVTSATDLFVMISVGKNPANNGAGAAAFSDEFSFTDFQPAQETTFEENSGPGKADGTKFQSCNGNEEFGGNFQMPNNREKVLQSDDSKMVSSFANHQQWLPTMAQESRAAVAGDVTLNLTENAPPSVNASKFFTRSWKNASDQLQETKTTGVGKSRKRHKPKPSTSPLGATEQNNITTVHDGGVKIDGRLEKSHHMRERKKSKYLSFPYIDPLDDPDAERNEAKEGSNLKLETESSTSQAEGSKNAQKDSRKSCCGLNVLDKARIINLSSSEMLCELCLTASLEREYSGPVKKFFSCFRRFAFLKHEEDFSQVLPELESDCIGTEKRMGEDRLEHPSSIGKSKQRRRIADDTSIDIGFSCVLKNGPNGSVESEYPEIVPDASKSEAVDLKRRRQTVSGINEAKRISCLLDFSANTITPCAEGFQLTGYGTASSDLEEMSRKMGSPCTSSNQGLLGLSGNRMNFVQLLNDVQAGVPNFFQSVVHENKVGAQCHSTSDLMARQSEAEAIPLELASSEKNLLETQRASLGCIPERKKRGRKRKEKGLNFPNNAVAAPALDMSGIVAESNSIRDNQQITSPGFIPERKKRGRRRKEEAFNFLDKVRKDSWDGVSANKVNQNKVQNNAHQSAAVLLNFTSGFALPSVDSILEAFSQYGILDKSETRFLNNSTAQVVFVRSADAKQAFQSLQRSNPFGPALGSYLFQPLSALGTQKINGSLQTPSPVWPMTGLNTLPAPPGLNPQNGESPNLVFIKQNLEKMTSMLEKAGNNLAPETKAKLESEIKGFKEKVNSLVGSSS